MMKIPVGYNAEATKAHRSTQARWGGMEFVRDRPAVLHPERHIEINPDVTVKAYYKIGLSKMPDKYSGKNAEW